MSSSLALAQHVRGRRPVHVLHDDVVAVRARVLARVEHLHDVRVLEPRRRQGLAAEAVHERLVVGEVLREQLHSDGPLEHRVARLEHGGHPAGAQAAPEHVAAGDLRGRAHHSPPAPTPPPLSSPFPSCPFPVPFAVAVPVVRQRGLVGRGRGRLGLGLGRRRLRLSFRGRRLLRLRLGRRGVGLLAGGLVVALLANQVPQVVEAVLERRLHVGVHVVRHRVDQVLDLLLVRAARALEDVLARAHAALVEPRLRAVELRLKARSPFATGIPLPSSLPPHPATATAATTSASASMRRGALTGPRRGVRRARRAGPPPRSRAPRPRSDIPLAATRPST